MLKPSCFNCQEIKMLLQNSPWLSVWRSGAPEDQAPGFCPLNLLMASYVVVFTVLMFTCLIFLHLSLPLPPSLSVFLSLSLVCLSVPPVCICVHTHMCAPLSATIHIWKSEDRQRVGISSLLQPCGFWRSNLGWLAWEQAPLPAKPSCWPFPQF